MQPLHSDTPPSLPPAGLLTSSLSLSLAPTSRTPPPLLPPPSTHQTEHVDGFLERLEHLSDRMNNLLPGDDALRPGQVAAQQGVRAHHPIVIIPGVCVDRQG